MILDLELDYVIEGYWTARRRNLSKSTLLDYGVTFRRLVTFLGNDKPFAEVNGPDLNQFLDHLQSEYQLGKKSLLNAWIALSSLWAWAEKELGAQHVVRLYVERPKPPKRIIKPFTEEEVKLLLEACRWSTTWYTPAGKATRSQRPHALRDVTIMLTLLDTGLRASELCALKIRDYDENRGRLFVQRGKGDKERAVYVGDVTRQAIWRYLSKRRQAKPTAPIFATHTGRHLDRDALRKMIGRAGERANVHNAHPHRFRHTFAINFLRNGGNIFALQEMLGHSSLEMVRHYAKVAEMDLEAAQKRASVADNWGL